MDMGGDLSWQLSPECCHSDILLVESRPSENPDEPYITINLAPSIENAVQHELRFLLQI